jgi:type VI secretion system secreted protein Hcp
MTSKFLKLVFVTLALLLGTVTAPRSAEAVSVEMFIKIDGIDGESFDREHARWIQAFSVQTGLANGGNVAAGGGGAPKVHVSDLHFAHNVDRASPTLAVHAATGSHIRNVVIEFRKAGTREVFYKITLTDVLVTSVALNVTAESAGELVTLSFAKIEWETRSQNGNGAWEPSGKGGWDVKANAKS